MQFVPTLLVNPHAGAPRLDPWSGRHIPRGLCIPGSISLDPPYYATHIGTPPPLVSGPFSTYNNSIFCFFFFLLTTKFLIGKGDVQNRSRTTVGQGHAYESVQESHTYS